MGLEVVLLVLMVPALLMLDNEPDKLKVLMFSVPPAVVVKVPFTITFPVAILLAPVLLKVKLLYVPVIKLCDPPASV